MRLPYSLNELGINLKAFLFKLSKVTSYLSLWILFFDSSRFEKSITLSDDEISVGTSVSSSSSIEHHIFGSTTGKPPFDFIISHTIAPLFRDYHLSYFTSISSHFSAVLEVLFFVLFSLSSLVLQNMLQIW